MSLDLDLLAFFFLATHGIYESCKKIESHTGGLAAEIKDLYENPNTHQQFDSFDSQFFIIFWLFSV